MAKCRLPNVVNVVHLHTVLYASYHSIDDSTKCWLSSPACCCFASAGSTAVINKTLEITITNTSLRCAPLSGKLFVCMLRTIVGKVYMRYLGIDICMCQFYVDHHIHGWLCVWSAREKSSAFSRFRISHALSF